MLRTPICELLGIRLPILQAGMGRYKGLVTPPELVAAVSNAGGLGCLGATGVEPDELRQAIRRIRELTDRPFGVNLIIPSRMSTRTGTREEIRADIREKFPAHWNLLQQIFRDEGIEPRPIDKEYSLTEEMTAAQTEVVFEERVSLFVVALGDPAAVMQRARSVGMKVAGLAGNVRNARRQLAAGVDFVIAQGGEAGGHVGVVSTFPLVPQVVDVAGSTPVVAAGGIGDGRGVAAALALGAQAVWCGTAFLFSDEVNLHPMQRKQLSAGSSEDFVASRVFTGKPSRNYRNRIHDAWAAAKLDPLPMPHQKVLMEDFLEAARQAERFDVVSNPCGQIAGMLEQTRPAAQIVAEMAAQAEAVIRRSASFIA